jgi:hypothetical protein
MKTVLKIGAAALALSMMASASAFAQTTQTDPAPAGQGMTTGSAPMDSQSGQSMPGQGGATTPDASTSAAPPPAASDQGTSTQASAQGGASPSAAETADTPAGSPPSTYPACKHKGQDRCIQEASNGAPHHMKHHVMKSKTSTDAASDTTGAPATPPAPGQ